MAKQESGRTVRCSRCGGVTSVPEKIVGSWSAICPACIDAGGVKLRGATRRVKRKPVPIPPERLVVGPDGPKED